MIKTCEKEGCINTFDTDANSGRGKARKYCDEHKSKCRKSPLSNKYVQVLLTASASERTKLYAKFRKLEIDGELDGATAAIVETMMFHDWQDGDKASGKLLFGNKIPRVDHVVQTREIGERASKLLEGKTSQEKVKLLEEAAKIEKNSVVSADYEVIDDD